MTNSKQTYMINSKQLGHIMKNYKDHPLIGQHVKIKAQEHVQEFLGKELKFTSYTLDDPEMQKKISQTFPNVRIFPPGTMGTADYKPNRVNVYLNKDGIITEISNG